MRDYHIHSDFSDGRNTMEEMVRAAVEKGLTEMGFSDHSHVSFDTCCIPADRLAEYRSTAAALKEQYRDRIRILCGIEQDYWSDIDPVGYDYVIGSVHYLKIGEAYPAVDLSAQAQKEMVDTYFGGDFYAFAEAYFETVAGVVEKTGCDIIGHFDLVSKFNEKNVFFDEEHPRYVRAWQRSVDRLIPSGKLFEINTGAMSRGYRTKPYPTPAMIQYIRQHGGKLILSSDSHWPETLCYGFEELSEYVK